MQSATSITLNDASQLPSSGTNFILIGTEEISYTGISTNTLTGVTRGVRNTTAASHTAGATVTNTSDFVAWGEAASGDLIIDPGMWSIDNFGDKAICLIVDGEVLNGTLQQQMQQILEQLLLLVHQQHQDTCLYLHRIDT